MNHIFIATLVLILVATSALSEDAISFRDSHAMSSIIGDDHVAENAFTVHRRAMKMPSEERYEYLADWVLPNSEHNTIRTAIALTCSPNSPGVVDRRLIGSAGNWVLGVIELTTQHATFFVLFLKYVDVTEAIVLKMASTTAGSQLGSPPSFSSFA